MGEQIYQQHQEKVRKVILGLLSKSEKWDYNSKVENAFNLFFPGWNCAQRKRYGKIGDGGKWICNPHLMPKFHPCVVYSFGGNRDNSFEQELFEDFPGLHSSLPDYAECEIHIFDPTPNIVEEMKPTIPGIIFDLSVGSYF